MWLTADYFICKCLSPNANNRNQNNFLSDHQTPVISQVWLCDFLYQETQLLLRNKSDSDRLCSSREHGFFIGLAEESTHPQTVRTFLSFIIAPIARRVRAVMPLQKRFVTSPSTIWFWNISLSTLPSPPAIIQTDLRCLYLTKHSRAAFPCLRLAQKEQTN